MNGRTTVIAAIAITIIGSLYLIYTPSVSDPKMSKPSSASSNGIPGLEFKLSQISKSPPSVLVTLKNSHPSSTFTLLKWGTPLDPQALNLGVFKLTNADTGEEVKVDVIKFRRKMPPSEDDLQEIAPGTDHATEVVFNRPWMPAKPARYKVVAEGTFHGVWEKKLADIKAEELDAYIDSPWDGRSFASEEVLLTVD